MNQEKSRAVRREITNENINHTHMHSVSGSRNWNRGRNKRGGRKKEARSKNKGRDMGKIQKRGDEQCNWDE